MNAYRVVLKEVNKYVFDDVIANSEEEAIQKCFDNSLFVSGVPTETDTIAEECDLLDSDIDEEELDL